MSDVSDAQVRDLARFLAPDREDPLHLRTAVVQSFTADKVNVLLSGSGFAVGIRKLSDVDCRVGDTVVILKNGPDYFIIGRIADNSGSAGFPTGGFVPFGGATAPDGFILAVGANISRVTYARLFGVYGTTYGSGDGSTTFGTPDLRGRTLFGLDNMGGTDAGRLGLANTLGLGVGSETTTLTIAQLAVHSHTGVTGGAGAHDHNTAWDSSAAGGGNWIHLDGFASKAFDAANVMNTVGNHQHGIPNDGSGQAHSNMPPGMLINWLIKT